MDSKILDTVLVCPYQDGLAERVWTAEEVEAIRKELRAALPEWCSLAVLPKTVQVCHVESSDQTVAALKWCGVLPKAGNAGPWVMGEGFSGEEAKKRLASFGLLTESGDTGLGSNLRAPTKTQG